MKKIFFNKIIRDKAYERYLNEGVTIDRVDLTPEVLTAKLKEKLLEEAQEVKEATHREELAEELADVLEVVHTLAMKNGITDRQLEEVRGAKRASRGGFQGGHYVTSVTLDESHPMMDYYLKRPDKYPQG